MVSVKGKAEITVAAVHSSLLGGQAAGGEDWPNQLAPQHCTVPSLRIPQVCHSPALTCVNVPDGGEDWPSEL
jgi:hypothetical protein